MLLVSLPFPFAQLPLWSKCQASVQKMGLGSDPIYHPLLGFMKVHHLSQLWPYACPQCNKIQKIPRCSTPVSRIVSGKRMAKWIYFEMNEWMDGILMSIIHSNEIIVNLRLIQTWVSWNPSFYHCPIVLRSISSTSTSLKHNCHLSPDTDAPFSHCTSLFPLFSSDFHINTWKSNSDSLLWPIRWSYGKCDFSKSLWHFVSRCPQHCCVHLSFLYYTDSSWHSP